MKKDERTWIILTIFFLGISAALIYIGGIKALGFVHIFIVSSILFIYSTISSMKIRRLENVLPKKGNECFGYIYNIKSGDNGSRIFYVVVHLEQTNKNIISTYQTFSNLKFKCGQIVKCYYLKNKVVLDKKTIDIQYLPQNIVESFELNEE